LSHIIRIYCSSYVQMWHKLQTILTIFKLDVELWTFHFSSKWLNELARICHFLDQCLSLLTNSIKKRQTTPFKPLTRLKQRLHYSRLVSSFFFRNVFKSICIDCRSKIVCITFSYFVIYCVLNLWFTIEFWDEVVGTLSRAF